VENEAQRARLRAENLGARSMMWTLALCDNVCVVAFQPDASTKKKHKVEHHQQLGVQVQVEVSGGFLSTIRLTSLLRGKAR
jgi:hypothetical protein